jgi:indole-3-glycerol phosphate synthase
MDVLERILNVKRAELKTEKEQLPMRRAIEMASAAPPPRDFPAAIRRAGAVNIIAEVKRASPSRGLIRESADPGAVAASYAAAGAAAISVLTDAKFFLGAPEHLEAVREAVAVPLLRKDFIFDEYQLYRSRALGADALLLIARVLDSKTLRTLIGVTRSLHMEALVEIHTVEDLDKAMECGAAVIGVNNRNLSTMTVTLERSLVLADRLPMEVTRVSESGIETAADIARLRAAGYHAVLIGETLMKAADPEAALRALTGTGRAAG